MAVPIGIILRSHYISRRPQRLWYCLPRRGFAVGRGQGMEEQGPPPPSRLHRSAEGDAETAPPPAVPI